MKMRLLLKVERPRSSTPWSDQVIKLIASHKNKTVPLEIQAMTAIGGKESSGISLSTLKNSDDYAVVSQSGAGFSIHPLKGASRGQIELHPGEQIQVEDLTLGCLAVDLVSSESDSESKLIEDLSRLIPHFAELSDLSDAQNLALEGIVRQTHMERGLIIAKTISDEFSVVSQMGLAEGEPWLSETLIQETLKAQKPIAIQNIFGSNFDSNKSILATGFISVFTWPMVVRGQTVGLVLVGSQKPHSGLSEDEKRKVELQVALMALMLWFHLRDLKVREELSALRAAQEKMNDGPILTTHLPLSQTVATAKKVASTDISVLIQGETGVGKELMAQWIHKNSDRSRGPFVAVNCGAIPSELLESTLFGHKKGSFTGAVSDQIGKFQLASGGTLFLDEIADLPEILQVKLLRALQERVIEPVGAQKPVSVDVRILSASHKNIGKMIEAGRFREDLYFRLAEIVLEIPPLRERPEDIPLLAASFLKSIDDEKRFSTEAWEWLKSQPWKGNAREVLSAVKRAAVLSSGSEIRVEDLTRGLPTGQKSFALDGYGWLGGKDLDEARDKFVQEKIRLALAQSGGQKNKAAELLGITTRTLFRYLEDMPDVKGSRGVNHEA